MKTLLLAAAAVLALGVGGGLLALVKAGPIGWVMAAVVALLALLEDYYAYQDAMSDPTKGHDWVEENVGLWEMWDKLEELKNSDAGMALEESFQRLLDSIGPVVDAIGDLGAALFGLESGDWSWIAKILKLAADGVAWALERTAKSLREIKALARGEKKLKSFSDIFGFGKRGPRDTGGKRGSSAPGDGAGTTSGVDARTFSAIAKNTSESDLRKQLAERKRDYAAEAKAQGLGTLEANRYAKSMSDAEKQLYSFAKTVPDTEEGLKELDNAMVRFAEKIDNINLNFNIPNIPGNAGGTENFPGGLTQIHEKGPEFARMPKGSWIVPSGKTNEMLDIVHGLSKNAAIGMQNAQHNLAAGQYAAQVASTPQGATNNITYNVNAPITINEAQDAAATGKEVGNSLNTTLRNTKPVFV